MALAGLKRYIADKKPVGKKFVAVISGANMNFNRLRFVAERAELAEGMPIAQAVHVPFSSRVFRAIVRSLAVALAFLI
jgi:threonine dehydratase